MVAAMERAYYEVPAEVVAIMRGPKWQSDAQRAAWAAAGVVTYTCDPDRKCAACGVYLEGARTAWNSGHLYSDRTRKHYCFDAACWQTDAARPSYVRKQAAGTVEAKQAREREAGIYSNLPTILYVSGCDDAGEYGNASCPHCGAEGRYTYRFVTTDGRHGGAMRGCLSKYPQHPIAPIILAVVDKEREIHQHPERGGRLASWDTAMLDAVQAFEAGRIGLDELLASVENAQASKRQWMKRRFGGRR